MKKNNFFQKKILTSDDLYSRLVIVADDKSDANGPVVQLVRTLACHARGRGFEPHPGRHFFASVAQLVEQGTENPRVGGSIPPGGTNRRKQSFPPIFIKNGDIAKW